MTIQALFSICSIYLLFFNEEDIDEVIFAGRNDEEERYALYLQWLEKTREKWCEERNSIIFGAIFTRVAFYRVRCLMSQLHQPRRLPCLKLSHLTAFIFLMKTLFGYNSINCKIYQKRYKDE